MRNFSFLFALCLGLSGAAVQAQSSVSAGKVNAPAGGSVVVPIQIVGGQDVSALQFTLEFDSEDLTLAENPLLPGDALGDHAVGINGEEGAATLVLFSGSLAPFQETGILVSVLFVVSESAQQGATLALPLDSVEGADSEGVFVNVLGIDGSIQVGDGQNQPSEGENELIFPQIANGTFGDNDIAILMAFVNRTGAVSNAEIRFFQSDGTPFPVKLTDGQEGSTFPFSVAPGESVFLETDGSGAVAAGYARLISTAPLGGTLVFTTRDGGDTVLAEAGVAASAVGQHFSMPILFETGGSNTGIALVNLGSEEAEITLVLRDEDAAELGQEVIPLGVGAHLPQFASEFFAVLETLDSFEGSIEVWSSQPLSAVTIKTQGNLLTTFPVVELF